MRLGKTGDVGPTWAVGEMWKISGGEVGVRGFGEEGEDESGDGEG